MSAPGHQSVASANNARTVAGGRSIGAELKFLFTALAVYIAAVTLLVLWHDSRLVYNDMRGAPSLALFHGVPIYQVGLKRVVFSALYGPFSYLFHLPAAFFHSPQSYFVAACVISLLIYSSPLILFFMHARRAAGVWTALLLAIAFFAFTLNTEGLAFSSMGFSPDAATIGFAGLACAILFFHDGRRPWLDPVWITTCTYCSIGSKQNMAVLLAVLPIFGWFLHGRAFVIRLMVCFAAGLVVSLAVIKAVYGDLYAVYFDNVVMPRHFPLRWGEGPFAVQYLYGELAFLLFAIGCLAFLFYGGSSPKPSRMASARVLLFASMTVCVTPFSILGVIFWGGAQNALSPTLYFALLTLIALSYVLLIETPVASGRSQPALAVLALFAALHAPLLSRHYYPLSKIRSDFGKSSSVLAYNYDLGHPGEVYFPFNQVVVYFAEHEFYHADWGIGNLVLAKVPFSVEEVRRCIPPRARYVAYPPDVRDNWLAPYLTSHFKKAQLSELPGFSVFEME